MTMMDFHHSVWYERTTITVLSHCETDDRYVHKRQLTENAAAFTAPHAMQQA